MRWQKGRRKVKHYLIDAASEKDIESFVTTNREKEGRNLALPSPPPQGSQLFQIVQPRTLF